MIVWREVWVIVAAYVVADVAFRVLRLDRLVDRVTGRLEPDAPLPFRGVV